jgi:hypothetical protein
MCTVQNRTKIEQKLREETNDSEINKIIKLGHYAISTFDGVLWDKNVTKRKQKAFKTQ